MGDVRIEGKCSFFGRRRDLSHFFSQGDGKGEGEELCEKMWKSVEAVKALCRRKSKGAGGSTHKKEGDF